jgi:hypothetical protein
MYVLRLTSSFKRDDAGWFKVDMAPEVHIDMAEPAVLVTYRNTPNLPIVRVDDFVSREEAFAYIRRIEPTCPRISLGGCSPMPVPSWQEHLDWLQRQGLTSATEGNSPLPEWLETGQGTTETIMVAPQGSAPEAFERSAAEIRESRRALKIREMRLGPDHPGMASSVNKLAMLYYDRARYAEAEQLFRRAVAIIERAFGRDHPELAYPLNNIAGIYMHRGRYTDAESLFKRALTIREKALGPTNPNVITSLNNLAMLYARQARYAEAEQLLKRALAIGESLGPNHPAVAAAAKNLANLL